MASIKLRAYFDSEAANPLFTAETKVECVSTALHCEHNLKESIRTSKVAIAATPSDLAAIIGELRRKLNFDLEEQIKLERLKEAKRMEEELKQRLELVQENISTLVPPPEEHKSTKIKLLGKEVREAVQLTEREKTKEAKLWAAKFREEQKAREQNRLKVADALTAEEEKAQREKAAAEELKKQERERQRQERVEYLKALSTKRQQQLTEIRELIRSSKVPKHSISESPSAEHRHLKEQQRISIGELVKEHCDKYKEAKQTYEAKKLQQLITQKMTESAQDHKPQHYFYDVISERKTQLAEEQRRSHFKEELQTRQKRYASLIKEMYAPVVTREKQQELEKLKSRFHTIPRVPRPIDRTARPHSLMASHTESLDTEHSAAPKRKKTKSVQLADEEQVKRPDYLPTVRQMRLTQLTEVSTRTNPLAQLSTELSDLSARKDTDKVLRKANLLERKAMRKANILRASDPLNLSNLEQADEVDLALLSSMKAKLSLLSS